MKILLLTFSLVLSLSFAQDNAKTPGMETADDKDLKAVSYTHLTLPTMDSV